MEGERRRGEGTQRVNPFLWLGSFVKQQHETIWKFNTKRQNTKQPDWGGLWWSSPPLIGGLQVPFLSWSVPGNPTLSWWRLASVCSWVTGTVAVKRCRCGSNPEQTSSARDSEEEEFIVGMFSHSSDCSVEHIQTLVFIGRPTADTREHWLMWEEPGSSCYRASKRQSRIQENMLMLR